MLALNFLLTQIYTLITYFQNVLSYLHVNICNPGKMLFVTKSKCRIYVSGNVTTYIYLQGDTYLLSK